MSVPELPKPRQLEDRNCSLAETETVLYNTAGKPYKLSNINPATSLTPGNAQTITYTSFEKVSTISENNYNASFTYNSDDQRINMSVLQGSNLIVTRWYPTASFMKDSIPGSSKLYTYIGGDAYTAPCVAIRQGTLTRYYYLIRDHLGSIIEISDSTNTKLYEYSYDAWGRMRNPSTWVNYAPGSEPVLFTGRGFTGHEHLPWFNLINMNGRAYDPLIGQFLSPDNIIQSPYFTQNYNRYMYCLNNPLVHSDPSGDTYLQYMEGHYTQFDYRGGYYSEGQYYQPKLRGGGYAPATNISYDALYPESFSFEKHMANKGYVYQKNEYGIENWVPKEDKSYTTITLGEGKPDLLVCLQKNPEDYWGAKLQIQIFVFGNQAIAYNVMQSYSSASNNEIQLDKDWD